MWRYGRLLCFLLGLFHGSAAAQGDWFPFTPPWDDESKTAADASDLLVDYPGQDAATVIESRGFVRTGPDGRFYFENTGKRARFWGVNFSFNANFPPAPGDPGYGGDAEKVARRLAKLGVNVVRFHHMDYFASPQGIFDPQYFGHRDNVISTRHLDAAQLNRLDHLVYQLNRNGIYVNVNLKVARTFGRDDGLPHPWGSGFAVGVSHVNARMIELQREFARQLLDRVNPYSGKKYTEDPGVLCVEIANEDSLFGSMLNDGGLNHLPGNPDSLPLYYSEELDELWNGWLQARYASQEALQSAWRADGGEVNEENRMRNGDFASGKDHWSLNLISGAQAGWVVESTAGPEGSPAARVNVTHSTGTNWHVQFMQEHHAVEKGKLYQITFWARASTPGPINLDMQRGVSDWRNYGLSKGFTLTAEWRQYSAQFRANETDPRYGRVTFQLGARTNTIWLARVEYREARLRDLLPDEQLATGNIRRLVRSELGGFSPKRVTDQFAFYTGLDRAYFTGMSRFLKEELGLQATVAGTAPWWNYLGDTAVQAELDFVDGHYYWDHPWWVGQAWGPDFRIHNKPLVNELHDLSVLASQAVQGKPFTITEYNHVFPNVHGNEGLPLIALIGNLQDWDAIYVYSYAHSTSAYRDAFTTSFFDIAGNPLKIGQMPVAARIFLGGQNAVATEQLLLEVNRDDLPLGWMEGRFGSSDFLQDRGLDRRAFLRNRLRIGTFDKPGPTEFNFQLPAGSVASSNAELLWDRADPSAATFQVRSSGVQGAIGFLKRRTFDFGGWSFRVLSGPEHLSVLLQSSERASLRESRRMLFSVWTEYQNTGMVWNAEKTHVSHWGRAPSLLRACRLEVNLELPAARNVQVWALDATGARKQQVPLVSHPGRLVLDIDTGRDQTVWYEIELNEPEDGVPFTLTSPDLFELYSDGEEAAAEVGWMSLAADSGVLPPVLALLEYHSRGVLTSLAQLPVTTPGLIQWIPAVRTSSAETAVAILNPQDMGIEVQVQLRDAQGASQGQAKEFHIGKGSTYAFFINEEWTNLPADFEGSLEVLSSFPTVAFGMRATTNPRGDYLLTPFGSSASPDQTEVYFPQLAASSVYSTEILMLNPCQQEVRVRLEFFGETGVPQAAGPLAASSEWTLPSGHARRLLIPQGGSEFYGYARVTRLSGTSLPLISAWITSWAAGSAVTEISIPPTPSVQRETFLVLERPAQKTALALLNAGAAKATLRVEILPSATVSQGRSKEVQLEAGEKRALFFLEMFPDLPPYASAMARVTAPEGVVALPLLGIYNSRGDFLISALGAPELAGGAAVLPRFAAGGGYRTMLYLFQLEGPGRQGQIRFFDVSGQGRPVGFR
jgi:hypothetical protein